MKIPRGILSAVLFLALVSADSMAQFAFNIPPPPFPNPRCKEVHTDILTTIDVAGQTFVGEASGTGTIAFVFVSNNPAGTHRADYRFTELDAQTDFGGTLGIVSTTLAPGGQPISTIVGNVPGQDFPATEDVVFIARAQIGQAIYESVGPVHLRATNVTAFYPNHNGVDRYSLTNPVPFKNIQTGQIGFVLTQHVVTLAGDEVERAFNIPDPLPPPINCQEVHDPADPLPTTTTIEYQGGTYEGTASGTGTITITNAIITPGGTHHADYILTGLTAQTQIPEFGVITTTVDPTRTATSSITGNVTGQDFPATEHLAFFARASFQGQEYESVQPVVLRSGNVNAFYPNHNGTDRFELLNAVDFRNRETGVIGFRLIRHVVSLAP